MYYAYEAGPFKAAGNLTCGTIISSTGFLIIKEDFMRKVDKRIRYASLSIFSNTLLIFLKIIAGILSGSVSIISEAIHSSMDLIASFIAFFSIKMSSKPADKQHPYGHGKIENISAVIEGLLILIAAILIIKEAIEKMIHPTEIENAYIAIAVMIISGIVNFFVSGKLYKVAKEEDSIALEADALHLKTDVYTSLGVGFGLLLIKLTGINILDPIIAIIVALLIVKEGWELISKAFSPLLDQKLDDEIEEKINLVLKKYNNQIIDYHRLRTRKSGDMSYIDFHLTVNGNLTVKESHDLSESIEHELEKIIKKANIFIHIDPYTEEKTTLI